MSKTRYTYNIFKFMPLIHSDITKTKDQLRCHLLFQDESIENMGIFTGKYR